MESNSRKLLVLDLDSTLIWSDFKETINYDFTIWVANCCIWIKTRPNLSIFLDYCFSHYDVGVWSAATREYVLKVVNYIFRGKSLKFIMSGERCTQHFWYDKLNHQYTNIVLKKLVKIWNVKKWHYRKHNTLILDDNNETYLKNRGNAIPINAYLGGNIDNEFMRIIIILENVKNCPDVRLIDKK